MRSLERVLVAGLLLCLPGAAFATSRLPALTGPKAKYVLRDVVPLGGGKITKVERISGTADTFRFHFAGPGVVGYRDASPRVEKGKVTTGAYAPTNYFRSEDGVARGVPITVFSAQTLIRDRMEKTAR